MGRFINADTVTSTGQGILGNNMFAYCRNNPVKRKDASGTDDVCVTHADEDNNPLNDFGSISGGGGYANACNSIDAGYHYGVDFSMASNSSLTTGGIYGNGYTAYGVYSSPTGSSNISKQLQNCASKANAKVSGNGAVAGTKKHTAFASEVNNLGNSHLRTEVSYLNGQEVSYGTQGSIRFDVMQYDADGIPIAAWDFKTGAARLTTSRVSQMQARSGLNIPIYMIK